MRKLAESSAETAKSTLKLEMFHVPSIRPSSELRNKYNEISEFCHKYSEPVFITKNGKGDLTVMSIETYEKLVGKYELYKLLDEGMEAMKNNKVLPAENVYVQLERDLEV